MSLIEKPYSSLLGGYYKYDRPLVSSSKQNISLKNIKPSINPNKTSHKIRPYYSYYNPELLDNTREKNDNNINDVKLSEMSLDDLKTAKKQTDWVTKNIGGVVGFGQDGVELKSSPINVVQSMVGLSHPVVGLVGGLVNFAATQRGKQIQEEIEKRMNTTKSNASNYSSKKNQHSKKISTNLKKISKKPYAWSQSNSQSNGRDYSSSYQRDWSGDRDNSRSGYSDRGSFRESSKGSKDKGRDEW